MKIYEFRLIFHWSVFLRIKLIIFQHWVRQWLGADQASSHYLNQWRQVYWRIYASLGLNKLTLTLIQLQACGCYIAAANCTSICSSPAQMYKWTQHVFYALLRVNKQFTFPCFTTNMFEYNDFLMRNILLPHLSTIYVSVLFTTVTIWCTYTNFCNSVKDKALSGGYHDMT